MKIKKKGIVFWITGLSGSGKSTIGEKLKLLIKKKYGTTIVIHGDDIRNIYNYKSYLKKDRLRLGKANSDFCKLMINQNINIIFTTVGLIHELFYYNKNSLENYVEIYIKSDIKKLIKKKQKSFYKKKTNYVWGLDLKPEFPKKPDIIIENNFNFSATKLTNILYKKILNLKKF